MKSLLPCLALAPFLLTGCADNGYHHTDYPPGYYHDAYPGYYGSTVGIYSHDQGFFRHHHHHHGEGHHNEGHHVVAVFMEHLMPQ